MTDNETSRLAYAEIQPQIPDLARRVLNVVKSRPNGVMCYEVEDLMDLSHQTASATLTLLRRHLGLIHAEGVGVHPKTKRKWNLYKEAGPGSKLIDPKCGDGGTAPMAVVTREAVVDYLATCSDAEWDAILTEAAARAV